jgi:hypothetical protein
MKYITTFLLTAVLSVMAATSHASNGKFSLLECGLQLGGISKTHEPSSKPDKKQERSNKQVSRSIVITGPALYSFTGAQSNITGRRRMAPAFTVAKLGCSW